MALAELLHAIETEADHEAAAIVLAAERDAVALLDRARDEAAAAECAPVREQEPGVQAEAARRVAGARAEAARRHRAQHEQAFAQTLARLHERIVAARGDAGWPRRLAVLVDEALGAVPAEAATAVHADPRDAALVEAHLARRGVAVSVVADLVSAGGVVAETGDGRRAVNTLEARAATAESELRQRFAALAGGEAR